MDSGPASLPLGQHGQPPKPYSRPSSTLSPTSQARRVSEEDGGKALYPPWRRVGLGPRAWRLTGNVIADVIADQAASFGARCAAQMPAPKYIQLLLAEAVLDKSDIICGQDKAHITCGCNTS
jgi:hypothetical protein